MQNVLMVATGGALGAVARYSLSSWAARRWGPSFPAIGTLLVNVLGCLLLGMLLAVVAQRPEIPGQLQAVVNAIFVGQPVGKCEVVA